MAGSLLLLAVLVPLVLWLFVFRVRWYLSDMMFVVALASVPFGLTFRAMQEGRPEIGAADFLLGLPYAFMTTIPVLIGAWWGLRIGNTFADNRFWARAGLVLLGTGLVFGAFSAVPACIITFRACFDWSNVRRFDPQLLRTWLICCVTTLAVVPGLYVERQYRKRLATAKEQERLHRKKNVTRPPTSSTPSPPL